MLNLLVAIISEAYADVMDKKIESNAMERIAIMKEVGQSISEADRVYLDDMD